MPTDTAFLSNVTVSEHPAVLLIAAIRNYRGQNKVKLFVMKPAGLRFAETYYLLPNLPFNPLSYLVRFGSKFDLIPDYQTISNMSAIRSKPSVVSVPFIVIQGLNSLCKFQRF